MKILHLSNTPLSNAPANLKQIQNENGHEAELLLDRQSNTNKVFVGGRLWKDYEPQKIFEWVNNADVIHLHNFAQEQKIFQAYPGLWDLVKKKPHLIQYHSPRNSIENFETTLSDKSLKKAVIAQYHVRQYPEADWIVPNVIPIYDKRYMPIDTKWNDELTVSYAPSSINRKGWDDKGYSQTMPIMRSNAKLTGTNYDCIIDTPYEDCLLRKRWSHIGIDEVVTGSYHLSSLEYLSMGCITIANLDTQTLDAIKHIVGEEGMKELPWSISTIQTLPGILYELCRRRTGLLQELGYKSRAWMEKYWNPKNHVEHFERIYKSL